MRRGRVIMGANEAAVHSLLPHIERFASLHPKVAVEVRRVPSRQIAGAVLDRSIDFGVLTFLPADRGVQTILLGGDDIVLLTAPTHPLADRRRVTIEEVGRAGGDRAQRPVADARSRPARVRAPADVDQHPDFAAEPRRHQARGRDGDRRRAAAAAVRADRNRARAPGRGESAGAGRASVRCGWRSGRPASAAAPRTRSWKWSRQRVR